MCPACGELQPAVLPLTEAARAALAAMLGAKMSEVAALGVGEEVARESFGLLRAFVRHHVPARLKALDYLGSLIDAPR